jgi:hypothetical protein
MERAETGDASQWNTLFNVDKPRSVWTLVEHQLATLDRLVFGEIPFELRICAIPKNRSQEANAHPPFGRYLARFQEHSPCGSQQRV